MKKIINFIKDWFTIKEKPPTVTYECLEHDKVYTSRGWYERHLKEKHDK